MTTALLPTHREATSSGSYSAPRRGVTLAALVAGALSVSGTGTASPVVPWLEIGMVTTNGGLSIKREVKVPDKIAEFRRLSGLTWEQFANLFGVTRRAIHFWASGKPISEEHLIHLDLMLDVLRRSDSGSTTTNRHMLLKSDRGNSAFVSLADKHYIEAAKILGSTHQPITSPNMRIPAPAKVISVADSLQALEERVHPRPSKLIVKRAVIKKS